MEIFDSFGINREYLIPTHVNSKRLVFNEIMFQHPLTSTCGYYCLGFLLYRMKLGKTLSDFQKLFKTKSVKELYENDMRIVELVQKEFL